MYALHAQIARESCDQQNVVELYKMLPVVFRGAIKTKEADFVIKFACQGIAYFEGVHV